MDATPGADSRQQNSLEENTAESITHSRDADMTKRSSNHYLLDRPGSKKDNLSSYARFPKISLVVLRRSWKLKFVILLLVCAISVVCLYSGVGSLFVPSFSFNLILGQSDSIKVPRIAIELGPDDLKRSDFQQQDNFAIPFSESQQHVTSPSHGGGQEEEEEEDDEENVEEENVEVGESRGERRFPSSIIFGVSKCGTRAILEYLKLHPDVVAPMAEINFFNNETLFKRGTKWYLQQMPLAKKDQLIVEKSPDYFQTPECAPMIRKLNQAIKLILLLRDPVERLVSQYMQLLAKNPSLPRFEEWVINPLSDQVNTNIPSVMVSAYADYVEDWLAVFPRERILIIESNSLRHSPFMEMKRVEQFLELKPYFEQSDFYFNSTRGFYCLRYRSTGKTKCLGKSKGRQHIPVDGDVLDILYSFYHPYNERLKLLIGRKFPWS